MIHTNSLVRYFSGRKLDKDPNAMTSPSGKAPKSVTKNSLNVCKKPTFNA